MFYRCSQPVQQRDGKPIITVRISLFFFTIFLDIRIDFKIDTCR